MSVIDKRPHRARAVSALSLVSFSALFAGSTTASAQQMDDSADLPPVFVEQKEAVSAAPTAAKKKPVKARKSVAKAKPKPAAPLQSQAEPVVDTSAAEPTPPESASVPRVGSSGLAVSATTSRMTNQSIAPDLANTSDTATIISRAPGVSVYGAGGVSGLPVINGLADDRVRVIVGGVDVTSACGNHMNPPMSYISPGSIGSVEVSSGVTAVSKGGDNLGGTISIERADAKYARGDETLRTSGSVTGFYRSNGDGFGGSVIAEAATSRFSLRYDGSFTTADNYDRGDDGPEVGSTEYKSWNHGVTLSARSDVDELTVRGGLQRIPYQGFPNQHMDMGDTSGDILGNEAYQLNARYKRELSFGRLEASAFYTHVKHYMNFLEDKGGSTPTTGMPMFTDSVEYGYGIKLEMPVSETGVIRVGNELHMQDYNEQWDPVCSGGMMCMMGPNAFVNINDGSRNRVGTFLEWENRWSRAWTTLLGVRNDVVWMNTGDVQGYGSMMMAADDAAAAAFNARNHKRTDVNFDATAMLRYQPDSHSTYELSYGRKTRSPNLYERYTWGQSSMATRMISWFGDLNGYVGNLDLEPEVANTFSFTAAWRGGEQSKPWSLRVTPYYTYVEDFIDVDVVPAMGMGMGTFPSDTLKFANHDAELWGVNVSGDMELWRSYEAGVFGFTGTLGYVRGERADGSALYHMMPFNARLALTHQLGNWSSAVELQLVADKDRVDVRRYEPKTSGYALVNLRTAYDWENMRLDLGVTNLFDKLYYDPLGGRDSLENGLPVSAMGRSFNAALTVKF